MDDGHRVMTIAHPELLLRWANKKKQVVEWMCWQLRTSMVRSRVVPIWMQSWLPSVSGLDICILQDCDISEQRAKQGRPDRCIVLHAMLGCHPQKCFNVCDDNIPYLGAAIKSYELFVSQWTQPLQLWVNSADDKLIMYFSYFSQKVRFEIPSKLSSQEKICIPSKLSSQEKICMKWQSLYSGEN